MDIVPAYDATHENISHLPARSQDAGYTTGSSQIVWTAQDWATHPNAVRICQDVGATDTTADVLDVESGAATYADSPVWSRGALAAFQGNVRPGQRSPAIYCSASNVTAVVNALIAGGVRSGIGLWVANWNLSESQAVQDVLDAAGPFPIIGIQFSNGEFYDFDVFSGTWLDAVSGNFAQNPVQDLTKVRRGFTSVGLAWAADKNATSYSVKTYWRGHLIHNEIVTSPFIRVGFLQPGHTYTFKVRAHPGGSQGSDAEIKVTTR